MRNNKNGENFKKTQVPAGAPTVTSPCKGGVSSLFHKFAQGHSCCGTEPGFEPHTCLPFVKGCIPLLPTAALGDRQAVIIIPT